MLGWGTRKLPSTTPLGVIKYVSSKILIWLSHSKLLIAESITPSTMIPEHRLASLLQQVKQAQISKCLYHNTANSPSLYSDHLCPRDQFPLVTIEMLTDHGEEVWFLEFSHDGTRLASASLDASVIVWDTQV